MFGVVPKSLWHKQYPADENNMIPLAMRLLLVVYGDRKVLINSGIGDKQNEKFLSHFHLHGIETLEGSLKQAGYTPDDITDVFHTHLHFDHCGGSIKYNNKKELVPTFPNARYWVTKSHWQWANNPNDREGASFLKENIQPLQESGQLELIEDEGELFPGFHYKSYHGHTIGQVIPFVDYKGKTVVFTSDLLAFSNHIRLPWVMSYDIQPLKSLEEKKSFLQEAVVKDYVLFFEHDKFVECATVENTPKGIKLKEKFRLSDL